MFLVDTNVISERRKGRSADRGVVDFIRRTENQIFLPDQVVGELQSGIDRLRTRGDLAQALKLEEWVRFILDAYALRILSFDVHCALLWGRLLGTNDRHPVDKQIAATALVYDLTVVTRNTADFADTGVRLLNPFHADALPASPPA
jgi:predicted nucleic acid-binding protein